MRRPVFGNARQMDHRGMDSFAKEQNEYIDYLEKRMEFAEEVIEGEFGCDLDHIMEQHLEREEMDKMMEEE